MVVGLSAVRMGVRVRVPMPVSFGTRSQRFRSAIHLVRRTAFHLHLHRGVTDPETVLQALRHRAMNLLAAAGALVRHHDVATARDDAGVQAPEVQVMDAQYAFHLIDSVFDRL